MKAKQALDVAKAAAGDRADVYLHRVPNSRQRAIRVVGNIKSTCEDVAYVILCEFNNRGWPADYRSCGPDVFVWF